MLPGKKFTPEDIVRIAWRRKWLIVLPFVTITFATFLVALKLPERYRSETIIQIQSQRVPETYVRSTVVTTERNAADRLEAIAAQVLTRTNLERMIIELNLYPAARKNGIMEDIVQGMRKDIEVSMLAKGDAFRVSFTYSDRRIAAAVVQKLGGRFIDDSATTRTDAAAATTSFLDAQLALAEGRLKDLEAKKAEFRTRHAGELPTERDGNLQVLASTQSQIQSLSESINRDRDRRYFLERTLTELTADTPAPAATPPNAAATDPNAFAAQSAADQLQTARTALRQLQLRFTPDHPDVRRAQRYVAELELKAQQEALQTPLSPDGSATRPASPQEVARQARLRDLRLEIDGIDRVIDSKQAEQKSLQAKMVDYQRRVDATPQRESELETLLRDYDTVQKLYASLLARREDSKIAENLETRAIGEQFRTLEEPRVPERPISPNRPLIDLAGAAAGLAIGLGLVALLEYRDNTFKTEDEIVRLLSLAVVATIPVMLSRAEREKQRRRTLIVAVATGVVFTVGFAGAAWFFLLRG